MKLSFTIKILFRSGLIRCPHLEHFDVPAAIENENSFLTSAYIGRFLYPNDLTVVIDGLHAITMDTDTKIGTGWYGCFGEGNYFKITLA